MRVTASYDQREDGRLATCSPGRDVYSVKGAEDDPPNLRERHREDL